MAFCAEEINVQNLGLEELNNLKFSDKSQTFPLCTNTIYESYGV